MCSLPLMTWGNQSFRTPPSGGLSPVNAREHYCPSTAAMTSRTKLAPAHPARTT
jgi:hypothetical protein